MSTYEIHEQDSAKTEQEAGKFLVPAKALVDVKDQLAALETFVRRRFDELSMEVNATSQQMDFAEEDMARRFAEMQQVIAAISYNGDGKSPANAGVELSAVIETTEKSANQILDATDRLQITINTLYNDCLDMGTAPLFESMQADIQTIIMACEFQDITSQRIQKAVNDLHDVELRMSSTMEKLGIPKPVDNIGEEIKRDISTQDDIDALFG
jgi:hypothetical protein